MFGKIIAGDFCGCTINGGTFTNYLYIEGHQEYTFTKNNISSYEIISQDTNKSTSSALARGAVGGILLGPIGILAGGLGAKNKTTLQIAIYWIDGKKSMIELTSKEQINAFYKNLF
ncbi:MAG TPA: hypothetical protein IAB56_00805 [Candidatus Scybalousia intestinigallinarum]|nr:hypothetical protein [Candidatus Scybalousia intestinigallinarum]